MYNKTIIEFGFRMISWIIKTSCLCYLPQPSASADNTDLSFDNSWYHAQPHPIIVYYIKSRTSKYKSIDIKLCNISGYSHYSRLKNFIHCRLCYSKKKNSGHISVKIDLALNPLVYVSTGTPLCRPWSNGLPTMPFHIWGARMAQSVSARPWCKRS